MTKDNGEVNLEEINFVPILCVLKELEVKKQLNLLEWANPFRDEKHQSAAIAWLFSPWSSHGKAEFFQKSFLNFIKNHAIPFEKDKKDEDRNKEGTQGDEGTDLGSNYSKKLDDLIKEIGGEKPLTCNREQTLDGGSRIDICIGGSGGLLIENKPYSGEGIDQLKRYANHAKKYNGIVLFICDHPSVSGPTDLDLQQLCARLDYGGLALWLGQVSNDLLGENKWLSNESTFADLKDRFSLANFLKHLANNITENKMTNAKLTEEQIKIFGENWRALQNFETAKKVFYYQSLKRFIDKVKNELNANSEGGIEWKSRQEDQEKIGNRFYGFEFYFTDNFSFRCEFDWTYFNRLFYGIKKVSEEIENPFVQGLGDYCRKKKGNCNWKESSWWPAWKWAENKEDWQNPWKLEDDKDKITEVVDAAKFFRKCYEEYTSKEKQKVQSTGNDAPA